MLIIIVKRFFDILKMLCPEHPGITDGIILIKNVLRETIGVIQNDMAPIDLHHQAATIQYQGTILFHSQFSRLFRCIVVHDLTDLHTVLACEMIITADHICPCLFRPCKELFIKVRCDPVITVNKANPLPQSNSKSQVLRPALLPVIGRCDHLKPVRIILFIFSENRKGIVRRMVIHRYDLIIGNRLSHQGIQAPGQLVICCHIVNRYDHT